MAAVLGTAAILILYTAARNLVRRNPLPHRPGRGVKLGVVRMPVPQISRILVVVGAGVRRIPGLRRSNTRRRQHNSRGDDSEDLASHVVLHFVIAFAALGAAEWQRSTCTRRRH